MAYSNVDQDETSSILSKSIMLPENDESHIDSDLVFKCTQCNNIIGDSQSWVCSNDDLHTITLLRVTSQVQKGRQLMTSTEDLDIGSAYYLLKCVGCSSELGKIYQTTPKHLDAIRDMFTVDVDKIESYQVGSYDQVGSMNDLIFSCPAHKHLLSELRKVQQTVLTLHKRLEAIEAKKLDSDENLAPEFVVPQPKPITELEQPAGSPHDVAVAQLPHRLSSSSELDLEPVLSSSFGSRPNKAAMAGVNDSIISINSATTGDENFTRRHRVSANKRRSVLEAELVGSPNNLVKRGKFS